MKALERFSKRFYLRQIIVGTQIYLLMILGPLCGSAAQATPSNPNVVLGSTEPITTGNTTTVNLITEKAVINWQSLDTSDSQQLIFDKSGTSGAYFAVLNRVTGGGATKFDGILNGNGGHVIIVNPQGIVFGSTAVINAFKFTASGLGITQSDYKAWYNSSGEGPLNFTCGTGVVTNNSISTLDHPERGISAEQVHLIGKSVTNNGTIRTTSPDGLVVMAAGDKVYLGESGSSIVVDTGSSAGDNVVRNTGTIDATNGGILLAAGDIYSQAAIENAASFVAQADRDLTIEAPLDVQGDITLFADYDQTLPGDFHSTSAGPITAGGSIEVHGNDIYFEAPVAAGVDLTIEGRDCYQSEEWPWGNVQADSTLDAGRDITVSVTGKKQTETWVKDGKCGCGHYEYETIFEPGTITLNDDVTAGRNLTLYNNTYTDPGVTLRATNGDITLANDGLGATALENCEWLTGNTWLALRAGNEIVAPLTEISVTGSTLIMEQGPSIDTKDFEFANQAGTNLTLISNEGSVTSDMAKSQNAADEWQSIGATAFDDITLKGDGSINSGNSGTDGKSLWARNGNINIDAGQSFSASMDIEAGTDITAVGRQDDILLMGNATAGQNIMLAANDNVEVRGDLWAKTGNIDIYASDHTIHLWGDTLAGGNVLLNANTEFEGCDDQLVEAGGTITANGWLNKLNEESDGSLYLHANGDISLADSVQAASFEDNYGGGVSIISDNGKIFTPDGLNNNTLNVAITGRSVDTETKDVGVDLPYGPGKAAISIQSNETLKLGDDAELKACGTYDNTGADDRAGINFLFVDADIPLGVPREPGAAFDLAIYMASKNGSIEIDCPVTIASTTIPLPTILSEVTEQETGAGAMVADAYDMVKLGEQFKESLADGAVGDRLEVASRITEWLEDAVDRLPFPEDMDLPEGYNYVMRGAGLENPEITDGRAWVLESREKEEPFSEAAPIQETLDIKLAGCPALTNWLASELGASAEQVQILFASTPSDIQPCDTCARLQSAARILMDSDGRRIAALARVVDEFASSGAPPSEEQMTLIASALKYTEEGTDYAMASAWLDAMTQYVTILHSELGLTTEDSVAAADKYISPVTTSNDAAVAGYVSAQLAAI